MAETSMSHTPEDTTFPFGGYWKGVAANLIEGDGVRLNGDLWEPCLIVVATQKVDGKVDVILADRTVHVARVLADGFGRPIEGMSADDGMHARSFEADRPVWIRL